MAKLDGKDAQAIALDALSWTLANDDRAQRFIALTGIDADTLRVSLADDRVLAGVLTYLEAHEPDMLACADAMGHPATALVAARIALTGGEPTA